jgi:hypothetical protein
MIEINFLQTVVEDECYVEKYKKGVNLKRHIVTNEILGFVVDDTVGDYDFLIRKDCIFIYFFNSNNLYKFCRLPNNRYELSINNHLFDSNTPDD